MRLRFVVITDIHVGPQSIYEGRKKKLSELSLALLEKVLSHVTENIKPDFVVQLGDLIEDTDDASLDERNYRAAVALFDRLSVKVLHAIGNHDTVTLSMKTLLTELHLTKPYYSTDIAGFHCVVLMASSVAHTDIHIDAAQQEWLAHDLTETDKPTVIFLHHPIDEQDVADNFWYAKYPDYCFVEERAAVRDIIEQSRKVIAVFSGHVHQNSAWTKSAIPYFTVQSLVENLGDDEHPVCSQSYTIVDIDEKVITVKVEGEDGAFFEVPHPLGSFFVHAGS